MKIRRVISLAVAAMAIVTIWLVSNYARREAGKFESVRPSHVQSAALRSRSLIQGKVMQEKVQPLTNEELVHLGAEADESLFEENMERVISEARSAYGNSREMILIAFLVGLENSTTPEAHLRRVTGVFEGLQKASHGAILEDGRTFAELATQRLVDRFREMNLTEELFGLSKSSPTALRVHLLARLFVVEGEDYMKPRLEELQDPIIREKVQNLILRTHVRLDPQEGLKCLLNLSWQNRESDDFISKIMTPGWFAVNSLMVSQAIQAAPDSRNKRALALRMASFIQDSDPEAAAEWRRVSTQP